MSHSILVVDDEPMARNLLRLMLVREGFDVYEAVDGQDALDKLERTHPDLLILDVMMPGVDGISVCRKVREKCVFNTMPIIMLSARTDQDSVEEGLAAGATKYLTKPISAVQLTQHVCECLQ
ncbi:MAG: response regulator [Candidatus Promineifilaceae bacterium]